MTCNDFESASKLLTGRNSQRRKLDNNTYLERRGNDIAVRLHNTDVVLFHADGCTVFDSGGWRTRTTQDRMRKFSRFGIRSEGGVWYVYKGGKEVPYADGITYRIDEDGHAQFSGQGEDPRRLIKLKREVVKYVKRYMLALKEGRVPTPGSGDCFYCQLVDKETGRALQDSGHLQSHMDEDYFVPSLMLRSIERFPVSQWAKMSLVSMWRGEGKGKIDDGIAGRQLGKALKRFMFEQFGLQG